MFWSFLMSYADLFFSFQSLAKTNKPVSDYHLDCLIKSLQNLPTTQYLYKLWSPFSFQQKQKLFHLIDRRLAQPKPGRVDISLQLFHCYTANTKNWLEKQSASTKEPISFQDALDKIVHSINSGNFDEILSANQKARCQASQEACNQNLSIPNTPEKDISTLQKEMVAYIERQLKSEMLPQSACCTILHQALIWIYSLANNADRAQALEDLVATLDDTRTAYHLSEKKYYSHYDYASEESMKQRVLDTMTLYYETYALENRIDLNADDEMTISTLEKYLVIINNELLPSDFLYKAYYTAAGYTCTSIKKNLYKLIAPLSSEDARTRFNTWKKHHQQKNRKITFRKISEENIIYLVTRRQDESDCEREFPSLEGVLQRDGEESDFCIDAPQEHLTDQAIINLMTEKQIFANSDQAKLIWSLVGSQLKKPLEKQLLKKKLSTDPNHVFENNVIKMLNNELGFTCSERELLHQVNYQALKTHPRQLLWVYALKTGCNQVVKALLDTDVNKNIIYQLIETTDYFSPHTNLVSSLMIAAEYDHSQCLLSILLEHQKKSRIDNNQYADLINIQCSLGQTALIKAAKKGHMECVRLLLDYNAQTDISDYADQNTLRMPRLSPPQSQGYNAMMYSVMNGDTACLRYLLSKQAMLNIAESSGKALIIGVMYNQIECIKILLATGIDPDRVDAETTALTCAIKLNRTEMIQLLVRAGADPFSRLIKKQSKLLNLPNKTLNAMRKEHQEIILAFFEGSLTLKDLPCSERRLQMIFKNDIAENRFLSFIHSLKLKILFLCSSPSAEKIQSMLLFLAIENKYFEIIKKYTPKQLNTYTNHKNSTALTIALEKNDQELIEYLEYQCTRDTDDSCSSFPMSIDQSFENMDPDNQPSTWRHIIFTTNPISTESESMSTRLKKQKPA